MTSPPGMPRSINGPKRRTECTPTAVALSVITRISQISAVVWNQLPVWEMTWPVM